MSVAQKTKRLVGILAANFVIAFFISGAGLLTAVFFGVVSGPIAFRLALVVAFFFGGAGASYAWVREREYAEVPPPLKNLLERLGAKERVRRFAHMVWVPRVHAPH